MTRKGWYKNKERHSLASRGVETKDVNVKPAASNRTLIYGDFDNDGVSNIDDAHPFDKTQHGMVADFPLANDLVDIEDKAQAHLAVLKITEDEFKNQGYETMSRIKSMHSILNKLKRKYLDQLKDFAGVLVFIKDEKDAKRVGKFIESRFKVNKVENFFANPGVDAYKAIHYDIEVHGKPIEIQLTTKAQYDITCKTHAAYKQGKTAPSQGKVEKEIKR